MKFLIVDDEELARLRLTRYLRQHHPDAHLAEAVDGFEALQQIESFQPDVLFLDIEMPELTGFELLMQLEARPFKIIFQTAYDEFAVRAFEENAIDYLLKPFTDERLAAALRRAGTQSESSAGDLSGLDRTLAAHHVHLTKLMIKAGSRLKVVEAQEVIYFSSDSHVTRVFLKDIDYAYDYSLTFLEERLDPKRFVRTHRHSIVNLAHVTAVDPGVKASVTLSNGLTLPVSRERKKDLVAAMAQ